MPEEGEILTHILTLKDQVLKWAAPKNHQSADNTYGEGTDSRFGHVKVDTTVTSNSNNPVRASGIVSYVTNKVNSAFNVKTSITNIADSTNSIYNIPTVKAVYTAISNLETTLRNDLQSKINIVTSVNNSSDNNHIPTAAAVWNAISSYDKILEGVSLQRPQSYTGSIDNLTTAGYYIMDHSKNSPKNFSYGGETIYYTNALVTVKKQSNRIIQHVCATNKITSSSDNTVFTYKINGSEYTRYGLYNSDGTKNWKPWHVAHKPYTKTARAKIKAKHKGVDANSVVVYENTEGFIIRWKQTNNNQRRYPVHAELYEYAEVCEFSPALPITGPYVFGNLIGRMDIKITSTGMYIRSNVAPGGRIIGMDETYFVPRNQ